MIFQFQGVGILYLVILMMYKADKVKEEFHNSHDRDYIYLETNETIVFPIKVDQSTFSYMYLVFGLVFVVILMFITYPLAMYHY